LRVLLSFALEMEFAPWLRLRKFARVVSDMPEFSASAGDNDLRVIVTGMGSEAARRAASRALEQPADICIVCGLAGALREGHHHGEILAASSVREAESQRVLKVDSALLEKALNVGARECALCTCKYVVSTAADKRRMAALGDVVDMESFSVMEAAQSRGIPAIAVRVVSDLADEDLPFDFSDCVNALGKINTWRAAGMALRSPARLPGLLRLARHSRLAAKSLAQFLNSFVDTLSDLPKKAEASEVHAARNSP
jgi:adenosylhomocysteine nucleosidase